MNFKGIIIFLGFFLYVCFITVATYSYYSWKSEDTLITLNINDSYFYCESDINVAISSLSPVLDYRDGIYQTFKVNNIGKKDTTFSLSLNISNIDESLLVSSFKYKLVVDKTGGSNNCADTSNSSCEAVGEGNFSNFSVGMNTLVSSIELLNNSRYQYYLFMYIDGNMENDVSMQSSSMTATLGVCEIVVYLDPNGGSVSPEFLKLAAETSTYPTLPTPTRENSIVTYNYNNATGGNGTASDMVTYTFNNWYKSTDTNFTTPITAGSVLDTTTNLTLKAKWTPSKSITLPTPTKVGYTFRGWYSDSELTKKIGNAGDTYNPSKSITLYAKWDPNTYAIAYTLNGGTKGTNAPTSGTYDTVVTISNPTRSGYTFTGWTFNGNTSTAQYGTSSTTVTTAWSNTSTKVTAQYFKNLTATSGGTVTMTAHWEKTVTATFKYYNNQSTTVSCKLVDTATSCSVTAPGSLGAPSGYTFRGWSTSDTANATTSLTATGSTSISANTTYYASYSYTVTATKYVYNNSSSTATGTAYMNYVGTKVNASISLPSNGFTNTNWTFNNWSTSSTATSGTAPGTSVSVSSNATYYALWKKTVQVTVTFDKNGGSANTSAKGSTTLYNNNTSLSASVSFTAPSCTSRTGYQCLGYSTSSTATTSAWNAGASKSITVSGTVAKTATTLSVASGYYHVWKAYKVIIYFHPAGGTVQSSTTASDGTRYTWSINSSDGTIMRRVNGGSVYKFNHTINHGATNAADLPNPNNANLLKITKSNYSVVSGAEWKCRSGCTTSGRTYNETVNYSAADFCSTNSGDCTVILEVNWTINKVNITYNTNGGTIKSSTTSGGVTRYWSTDSNGLIYVKEGSSGTKTKFLRTINVGGSSSGATPNPVTSSMLNITKSGYKPKSGAEWICKTGCPTANKTFAINTTYNASDFCSATTSSCNVTLSVNWTAS